MNCQVCGLEFVDGERVTANVQETFVFKPAHIEDPEIFAPGKHGGMVKVNLAAVKSPDEMRELRKEHTRTAVAKVFATYGKGPLPEGAFNVRHDYCDVQRTGGALTGAHPLTKHSIRYSRSLSRRGSR